MKIKVYFTLDSASVSADLKRAMISYLKHALELYDKDLYEKTYGTRETKQFCTALYLPGCKRDHDNNLTLTDNTISMDISGDNNVFILHLYNALTALKNKKYPVGSNNIMSTKIVVSRTNPVRASMILVKTKSPLIFKHRTKDGYEHCSVEEANFSEFAKDNINSELSMLNENVDNTIEIIPLKAHKVYDKIFDMTFPASVGTFILKARPDTLTKLLRYGIGGRRGEGYGMIELITEVRDE